MINTKEIEKKFGRDAVKTRMIDLASRLHGYEHFELESFDPLVDLMLSALAKEIEKSHLYFKDTFNDLCNHLTSRLIPESDISFVPSSTIVQIKSENENIISPGNFKCTFIKEDDEDNTELSFVPLLPTNLSGIDVKLIANGTRLISYAGLQSEELIRYKPEGSSIYLGIKIPKNQKTNISLPIYFSWFEHPKTNLFIDILSSSEWYLNGKEINVKPQLFSSSKLMDKLKFWNKSYFKEVFKEVAESYNDHYFRLEFLEELIEANNEPPQEIINLIKRQPELSYANELHWLEIKLPNLEVCRELGLKLYTQTNCVPFINLHEKFETHKVRDPYKVIRITGDEYFVDVKKLYNYNEGQYLPKYNFESNIANVQGYYHVARNSILRIDKRVAVDKIVQLVDLVREERNAFSAFNPDWIIDELQKIKINFQRIEYKLGENLNIEPMDVFISLEDDQEDNTIRVEYWTCHGSKANGLVRGTKGEVQSGFVDISKESIVVEKSSGGRFSISDEEKIKRSKYQLQTKDRIVTKADLRTAIEFKLSPVIVEEINFKTELLATNSIRSGYARNIIADVRVLIGSNNNVSIPILERSLQYFINQRIVSHLNYKIKITPVSDEE